MMQDLTRKTLTAEMTELRNKTVELGNMTEIKVTMPEFDRVLASRWEFLLDTIHDMVADFAEHNDITLPEY